jgi:hypothetical protein
MLQQHLSRQSLSRVSTKVSMADETMESRKAFNSLGQKSGVSGNRRE